LTAISNSTFKFLKAIEKNNNRPWFQDNKLKYEAAHLEMIEFTEALMVLMNKHDNLVPMTGKKSLFRIYRDVRFSKDKSPYKAHWAGGYKRDTPYLRGGYYFQIKPGNSIIAGGFWNPSSPDLLRIRQEIAANDKPFRKIFKSATFKKYFNQIEGEKLKTSPKGFDKEHPALDLLQHKQFLVYRHFTDAEVKAPGFIKEANKTFKAMRPFFNLMSEVLTTDINGSPIV
jgi:uncharacterized protein (TIGR02453 family)